MKIGMEFRDNSIENMDFSNVEEGNPGCGGTQFEFALLAHHLLKLNKGYEIILFHFNNNIFEKNIVDIIVKDINDIPIEAKKHKVDILLFWSTHDDRWYCNLENYKVKSIAWSHNFLNYPEIKNLQKCEMVKKVVSVSKEQYELLMGEDIFGKCTYIHNMFDFKEQDYDRKKAMEDNIVCCIGTLIKPKGFHILAKEWKKIISSVPNAQLYIMGTGSLWNQNMSLGRFGLAEESYEKLFMCYLTDDDGMILPSVHFLGNVGVEKKDIFRKCKVGVVNPTGVETFCISAIEMESEQVPVCSKYRNGLIDTILDGKTGYLFKREKNLSKCIISLLSNDDLNLQMGREAVQFSKKFSGDLLALEWDRLFQDVLIDNISVNRKFNMFSFKRFKFLRCIVGKLRTIKILRFIPSPYQVDYQIWKGKRLLVKIRNTILQR